MKRTMQEKIDCNGRPVDSCLFDEEVEELVKTSRPLSLARFRKYVRVRQIGKFNKHGICRYFRTTHRGQDVFIIKRSNLGYTQYRVWSWAAPDAS